nr:hypothetical protein [Tanacetum cinerariifolium]
TSPPRDESSDSDSKPEAEEADDEPEAEEVDDVLEVEEAGVEPEVEGADVELEAKEPDGVPEATIGTGSQRPFAREILHHDLSGVKETLGKVVERLKVLESEENATLRKKLAEKEVLLDLTRMERDMAEKRLSESIWWNKGFYLEMVHKGAIPKPPSDDEGPERPRKTSKKSDGDEGPFDPRGSLKIMPPKPMSEARMREIIRDQFATSMNEFMANMNSGAGGSGGTSGSGGAGGSGGTGGNANGTGVRGAGPTVPELTGCTYATFIKCDPLPFNGTEGAVGLTKSIRGDVTSLPPTTINDAVRLAYQLAGQLIQDKADEVTEGEKRKGESDRGGRGDNRREHNRRQNQRRDNAGAMTNAAPNNNETFQKCNNKRHAWDCWKCTKCGKLGHKTERCRTS